LLGCIDLHARYCISMSVWNYQSFQLLHHKLSLPKKKGPKLWSETQQQTHRKQVLVR
jgi:hypothetical protein